MLVLYASNALYAKLLAIRHGLDLASEANYTHIVIYSDCKQAVDMVNNTILDYEDFYSDIVMDYRELLHYFQETRLLFVRRKDNQVADALSHRCRSTGGDHIHIICHLPTPPD